jgi:3-methyladenine DNA glycosylase AlkD
MNVCENIIKDLKKLADPEKVKILSSFFKTGKGQYGEGDIFWGIKVPDQRKIVNKYFRQADIQDIERLLDSEVHEERLTGALLIVKKYTSKDSDKKRLYDLYIKKIDRINNWDLVDLTAPKIVGDYLFDKDRTTIIKLSDSGKLWQERISVLSTFYFIRQGEYKPTLELVKKFLTHKHDLMHKACGWMLRETGKKDYNTLYAFLEEYSTKMPRTMLRYAIERFDKDTRQYFLKK